MKALPLIAFIAAPALASNTDFASQTTPAFRGDVGARYDLYDLNFTVPVGGPNAPDAGSFGATSLTQHTPGVIDLGGDYLYGLSGAPDFTLAFNNAQPLEELSFQIRVEGIPLENSSVMLEFTNASGFLVSLPPSSVLALNPADPNEQQFIWDAALLAGLDTANASLAFAGSGAHNALDVVVLDYRLQHDGLIGDVPSISVGTGGDQHLELDAGTDHAGDIYFVVGSLFGTGVGTPYEGLVVPLVLDMYTFMTINQANSAFFQNTLGTLDGFGMAAPTLHLPVGQSPALVGLHADHAAIIFDGVTLAPVAVTGAEGVDLTF